MASVTARDEFKEGTAFRVLLPPRGLDGTVLLQPQVTSWDLKVFDLDRRSGDIDTPIYELLGQDPAGTNPDGNPYIATSLQTGNGWAANNVGYSFQHDMDTNNFQHAGGRRYEFRYRFATTNGDVADILRMRCFGDPGES